MKRLPFLLIFLCACLIAGDFYYYRDGQKITLMPRSTPESQSIYSGYRALQYNAQYFETPSGRTLGVADRIILRLNDGYALESLLETYNLSLIKDLKRNMYVVQAPDANSTLDIANSLHEDESVEFAHPDFIIEMNRR